MTTQERAMEVAKLRLRFQMNGRLRLESLAALSKVFREYGEPIREELLGSIVFAVPEELLGPADPNVQAQFSEANQLGDAPATPGKPPTGGAPATPGKPPTGGAPATPGGKPPAGGTPATPGNPPAGGTLATPGKPPAGGTPVLQAATLQHDRREIGRDIAVIPNPLTGSAIRRGAGGGTPW